MGGDLVSTLRLLAWAAGQDGQDEQQCAAEPGLMDRIALSVPCCMSRQHCRRLTLPGPPLLTLRQPLLKPSLLSSRMVVVTRWNCTALTCTTGWEGEGGLRGLAT